MAKKTTAKKKPSAKKKTAAENQTEPKGKSGPKSESTAAAKKEPVKQGKAGASKKLSPKDLLRKRFGEWKPETLFAPAQDQSGKNFEASPFGKNIRRDILMRKFDFDFADVACAVQPSRGELLRRKFGAWKAEKLFVPPADTAYQKGFAAPGFGEEISRKVLMRKFDFDFADVAWVPPPPREELIRRKFGAWKAEKLFVPPDDAAYQKGFAAPDFGNEIRRDVLMRKFDFDFAEEAAKAKAEAERKAAEEAAKAKAEAERKAAEAAAKAKAEAERKAAEAAAKAKAEAERKAAEAAAKAKAEAERKAAEEAAKAKAEAEKKAAEAAAKAKAEAERKAAEAKAAAEKAEAERKAAEEAAKAKAEAERKAAEEAAKAKAEAERKAAKPEDPLVRMLRYATAGIVLLFSLIIAAAYSNSSKYYLEPTDIGIQIWKGRFAPMGKELFLTLKGRTSAEPVKDLYTEEEVSEMACDYFIEEADAVMKSTSYPSVEKVKTLLDTAASFAKSGDTGSKVREKLNGINFRMLLYTSDVAVSSGNLKEALNCLQQASGMKLDDRQAKLLEVKAEAVRKLMESELSGKSDK